MTSLGMKIRRVTPSASASINLRCGGQACYKCGACRDWYLDYNTEDIVKRNDATCTCDRMFCHSLVPHPDHVGHKYYPLQNLICMCRDNY